MKPRIWKPPATRQTTPKIQGANAGVAAPTTGMQSHVRRVGGKNSTEGNSLAGVDKERTPTRIPNTSCSVNVA